MPAKLIYKNKLIGTFSQIDLSLRYTTKELFQDEGLLFPSYMEDEYQVIFKLSSGSLDTVVLKEYFDRYNDSSNCRIKPLIEIELHNKNFTISNCSIDTTHLGLLPGRKIVSTIIEGIGEINLN